jgi:hypothetical protein
MLNDLREFVMIFVEFFRNADKLTYAAIGVGVVVAALYFKIIFGGFSGFKDDVNKTGQTRIGHNSYDRVEGKWASHKIIFWLMLSIGCAMLAYHQLPDWLPDIFPQH